MDAVTIIFMLLLGIFAGGFGAIIGSSLLVIVPSLVFLGLPVHVALGTGKLSGIFRDIPALVNYHKSGKVDYRAGTLFAASAVAGTVAASLYVLPLSGKTLEIIISVCMLIIAVLIVNNPSRGLEEKRVEIVRGSCLRIVSVGFIIGLYDGIFGGGVSLFIILSFIFLVGHDFLKAVGTAKIPNIINGVIFVCIFAAHQKVDYLYAIPLAVGMTVGGHLGSKFALVRGNRFVRALLISVIVLMALKLLLF